MSRPGRMIRLAMPDRPGEASARDAWREAGAKACGEAAEKFGEVTGENFLAVSEWIRAREREIYDADPRSLGFKL